VTKAVLQVEKLLGIPNPRIKWRTYYYNNGDPNYWKAGYKKFSLFIDIVDHDPPYLWQVARADLKVTCGRGYVNSEKEAKKCIKECLRYLL